MLWISLRGACKFLIAVSQSIEKFSIRNLLCLHNGGYYGIYIVFSLDRIIPGVPTIASGNVPTQSLQGVASTKRAPPRLTLNHQRLLRLWDWNLEPEAD